MKWHHFRARLHRYVSEKILCSVSFLRIGKENAGKMQENAGKLWRILGENQDLQHQGYYSVVWVHDRGVKLGLGQPLVCGVHLTRTLADTASCKTITGEREQSQPAGRKGTRSFPWVGACRHHKIKWPDFHASRGINAWMRQPTKMQKQVKKEHADTHWSSNPFVAPTFNGPCIMWCWRSENKPDNQGM